MSLKNKHAKYAVASISKCFVSEKLLSFSLVMFGKENFQQCCYSLDDSLVCNRFCSFHVAMQSSLTKYDLDFCRGQVPAEAEASFLKKAATLDTYGVDPHKVKVDN